MIHLRNFILLLYFLLNAVSVHSQWSFSGEGIYGGDIRTLAYQSPYFYCGTAGGGCYRSADAGQTWISINDGISNFNVYAIAANNDYVFVGTYLGGIYRSGDQGLTWIHLPGYQSSLIMCLAIDGGTLYAGISQVGIVKSNDNGMTWTSIQANIPYTGIQSIAASGNDLFAATQNHGLYHSSNGGVNWTRMTNGLTDSTNNTVNIIGSTVFAGTDYSGAFRSTDMGQSWQQCNNGLTAETVLDFTAIGATIYAATGSGIFRTTNNGSSWQSFNNSLTENKTFTTLASDPACIVAGNDVMVARTPGESAGWQRSDDGISNVIVNAIYQFNGDLWAGTGGSGIFKSTDNGLTWESIPNSPGKTHIYCFASIDNVLIAGTSGGFLRTINNGTSWSLTGQPFLGINSLCARGQVFFAATNTGIFKSTNLGQNWVLVGNGAPNMLVTDVISAGSDIFACSPFSGIVRSSDDGESWISINNGLPEITVWKLFFNNGLLFSGPFENGAFTSNDRGDTWNYAANGLSGQTIKAFGGNDSSTYAGTVNGFYYTLDSGSQWVPNNEGLALKSILCIWSGNEYVFAGTNGYSLWRIPRNQVITGTAETNKKIASAINLLPNYPNPFNGNTTICFELKGSSEIELTVMDITGRTLEILVNKRLGPGRYQYQWNSGKVPGGIYLYKITSCNEVKVGRMSVE
jgi:photosystem II stability/assembly factor-like uncharacterized protein